ncbi:MAG: cytochrome P450 [Myxococcota bacterium]
MASPASDQTYPTGIQLTVFDPDFRADPYPVLARTREKAPIHFNEMLGSWIFTRHDDVLAILRNPDFVSDPRKANPDSFYFKVLGGATNEEPSMLLMDDPGHRRLRELVRHPFAPRAIERWRDRARTVARRYVDALPEDEFDLIEAVANPVPTVVIAELLGLDPERHEDFKTWSDAIVKTAFSVVKDPAATARSDAARESLSAFFLEEIDKRRSEPSDDLITAMTNAEESGDRLTDHEIVLQCNLLLLAGNLTTSDLISNAVMALVRHPEQQAKLRGDRSLMKNAVEEVLRYDTPVTNSGRIAHDAIEIGGFNIPQGSALSVSLAAANRDPAAYPEPDRFDILRKDTHHQAFGGGRHFCLGAHLARLEAAETLDALLDRFSSLERGEGPCEYAANQTFRGLSTFALRGRH